MGDDDVEMEDDDVEMEQQPSLELEGLTAMIRKMFGSEVVECLKKKYTGLRGFLESTNAVTQCKNVIGDYTSIDVRTGKQHACWICGFQIVPKDETFTPECEHIFPIAQAVMFIGLYREVDIQFLRSQEPGKPVKDIKKSFVNAIAAEYGWAHRLCNQVKRDRHFIGINKGAGPGVSRWNIDEAGIKKYLRDIIATKSYNNNGKRMTAFITANKPKAEHKLAQDEWVDQRTKVIWDRYEEVLSGTKPEEENISLLAAVSVLEYDIMGTACVDQPEEVIPVKKPPFSSPGKERILKKSDAYSMFGASLRGNVNQLRPALARFVTERIDGKRTSPEDRIKRATAILPILELTEESTKPLYDQILARFDKLRTDTTINPEVLLNELTSVAMYSALLVELKKIQAQYSGSIEIKTEIARLERNLEDFRRVRPQYAARRSKTRRNKKKKGTRRKKAQ